MKRAAAAQLDCVGSCQERSPAGNACPDLIVCRVPPMFAGLCQICSQLSMHPHIIDTTLRGNLVPLTSTCQAID
jgi:hypothetical protein